MEKKPLISVMILCYNYGHMLGKALEACAAQTFRDFEVVMINNGSTDDTEAVYRRFCAAHPEIPTTYVLVDPNRGPTNGWNHGLKQARGEYVLFNDADDWMEPECLRLLAEKALETGADRVTSPYQEVLPDGTVTRVRRFEDKELRLPTAMLQGTIFRRAVILDNELWLPVDNYISYDVWFTYHFAIAETNRGQVVRQTVYNYYYNPTSLMTQSAQEMENRFTKICLPQLMLVKEAMEKTTDVALRQEMEYHYLRNMFSTVISYYQRGSRKAADTYYLQIHDALKRELPGYSKNPLLWKINNGFERPGSIACMAVGLLDRLKSPTLLYLLARLGKGSSLLPKRSA